MSKLLQSMLLTCFVAANLSAQVPSGTRADDYNSIFKTVKWRSIGPFRGGRSNAGCGVVGDPKTYYMGTTGGGLWKTDDMGITWRNVSDGYFKTGSVGAVAVAESDPNVVYVGMGEHAVRGVMTHSGDGVMYAKTMSAQPAIAPLQIQSVVDHVYSALRERILSGDLPRGTKLRQASLADELGVSRTPLREALRRLSTEGLVEFSPNRGATVSELDFGDMRHAWSARVALEPGAARLAAQRRDADAIAAMRDAVKLQRQAAGDGMDSFAANRSFHLALAAASGNPHLTRFAEMLWVPRIGVPIYQAQAAEPRLS